MEWLVWPPHNWINRQEYISIQMAMFSYRIQIIIASNDGTVERYLVEQFLEMVSHMLSKVPDYGHVLFCTIGTMGNANNLLYYPYELWCDENSGMFYIADSFNHRIVRYPNNAVSGDIIAGNNLSGLGPSQLSYPYGFHFESLTNSLLIANTGGNNIVRWRIGASNWTLVAGSSNGLSGSTATLLSGPTDVLLDPMGNMYVVDMGNHRIQFFSSDQTNGVTIAGSAGLSGVNATLLNLPSTLTLDNQLNLYVVDQSNNRIQKFCRY